VLVSAVPSNFAIYRFLGVMNRTITDVEESNMYYCYCSTALCLALAAFSVS
jgi:hypothetical protein